MLNPYLVSNNRFILYRFIKINFEVNHIVVEYTTNIINVIFAWQVAKHRIILYGSKNQMVNSAIFYIELLASKG